MAVLPCASLFRRMVSVTCHGPMYAAPQGVTPGNVVFKLREQPNHPRFRREGNDLHHTMHITLKEALLGFRKSVLHLDGRLVGDVVAVNAPLVHHVFLP
jgi:DnaJ-class molecular chaperone